MKNCPKCRASYPTNYSICPQDGTPLEDSSAWTEGALIRGKYRVLSKIGEGGMGSVYKALHVVFNELRALKVISPALMSNELFVKRFEHEAIIMRSLVHPNAVRVDDFDEAEDGRPFIIMEYIEGKSLKQLIQEEGPVPVLEACSIVKQVAAALSAAHELGMVHRDIKPDNIVLVESPQGQQAKVLDFGIAKIKEARAGNVSMKGLSSTNVIMGTPQYMSPEQAMGKRGDELDGRSDLYSLGVVMYEILSGDLPFKAETTMSMLLAHLQTPPRPLLTLHRELQIPVPVANLVMKTLEKNPADRPPSAEALITEIEKVERAISPREETLLATPKGMDLTSGAGAAAPFIGPQARGPSSAARQDRPSRPAAVPTSPVPGASIAQYPAEPPEAISLPMSGATRLPPTQKSSKAAVAVGIVALLLAGTLVGLWYFGGRFRLQPRNASLPPVGQKEVSERINQGDAYLSRKNFKDAILEYKRASELDPSNLAVKDKLAQAEEAESAQHALSAGATQARLGPVPEESTQLGTHTQPRAAVNSSSPQMPVPAPTQIQPSAQSNHILSGSAEASASVTRVTKNGFTFELKRCRRPTETEYAMSRAGNAGLLCDFVITNNSSEDMFLSFGKAATAFDDLGNSYRAESGVLGNVEQGSPGFVWGVSNTVLSGAPTMARLIFGRFPLDAKALVSLDMDCSYNISGQVPTGFKIQFRNIPIGK